MMSKAFSKISKLLPEGIIVKSREELFKYSFDNARISRMPELAFIPQKAKQVAKILKIANKHKIAVTVRGAGSGATGCTSPVMGGWVISLEKFNKIKINKKLQIAEVGAGAVIANVQNSAKQKKLFYPPDPSSHKFATIGGSIATNAGGLRCVKYGVTRDYVLALEGYLADGNKFKFALPTKKFSSGYNLRDLIIGSEGTLAVVTKIYLRLIPLPEKSLSAIIFAKNYNLAFDTVTKISEQSISPSIIEFLDRPTLFAIKKVDSHFPSIHKKYSSALLLEVDAHSKTELSEKKRLLKLLLAKLDSKLIKAKIVTSQSEADKIWQIRRNCSQAMFAIRNGVNEKLNQDVVVPLNKQLKLLKFCQKLAKKVGLPNSIAVFGHAGDGNLHVNIMFDKNNSGEQKKAARAVKLLMQKVITLGGAISGEHGIGLTKSPFLKEQFKPHEIQLMQSLKSTFDPNNILNPDKIFFPINTWKLAKTETKLPWDKDL